jgi:hypothetical protein
MDDTALEKIVKNRVEVARKWHGLTDDEAIVQFVAKHPDLNTPEAKAAVLDDVVRSIITADDAQLAELAGIYGVERVNAILAEWREYQTGDGE